MFATNFNECIESIKNEYERKNIEILYLQKENERLKAENYKDIELQKMEEQLNKFQKDYWRGFPITEYEEKSIEEWKKKHEEEVHSLTTNSQKLKAEGCCGGRYSYHFVPTSIGTAGVIRCHCGAEFEFQEIG